MLESLHDAGRQHDLAGNRKLHMDQYMSLLLLYMFNPICTSLRALQIGRMCRLAPNGRRSRRLHHYSAGGHKAINLKRVGRDTCLTTVKMSHRSD